MLKHSSFRVPPRSGREKKTGRFVVQFVHQPAVQFGKLLNRDAAMGGRK